ncbi:MAG: hypothetical protein ABFD44_02035 [Anaerolineaceae bacterium]
MKLDRTFTVNETEETLRAHVASYFISKGYKQRESGPNLVFERGSGLGSMISFSTKKWKANAAVETKSNPDQSTNVVVTLNIETSGQIVVKKERDFWENELNDLVASVKGFNVGVSLQSQLEDKLRLEKRLNGGISWFYWVAGLSLINSIIFLFGGQVNFVIGLGITQVIDGISSVVAGELGAGAGTVVQIIAFLLDALVAGVFVLFGVLARRHKWSFIVGMIVYALDGLIFILVSDYLSLAFHLIVLCGLFSGLSAFRQIREKSSTSAV